MARFLNVLALASGYLPALGVLAGVVLASCCIIRAQRRPFLLVVSFLVLLAGCGLLGLLPGVVCALLALAVVSSLAVGWLPAGLVWAVFAWSVSIAVGWTLGRIAGLPVLQAACHAAAFSAAWWTVAAAMAKRWPNRWAGEAVSAFVMTAAAGGVAVAVMLAYDAALVGIWRVGGEAAKEAFQRIAQAEDQPEAVKEYARKELEKLTGGG